jgi:hypothetical protein
MKLLQVGCFAAASVQAQDYEGSAVDYTLDETRGDYEYEYDQFGNKKKKKKKQASYQQPSYQQPSYQAPVYSAPSYSYDQYDNYAKAYTTDKYHAYALNCWPANFDTDKLVYNDATNADPYEKYNTGPLHYYGSEYRGLTSAEGGTLVSPADGDNNRGGKYHYGWENDESTGSVYRENAAPSEWIHYHSARHAGCFYEMAGFDYSADTYDHVYNAFYYNGYFNSDYSQAVTPAVVDTSISYVPNWVHFFNAHLLVSGDTDSINLSTAPSVSGTADAGDGYANISTVNAKLVIANPQYEGLGYLNFIATYKVKDKDTGDHYQEFIDMTERTQNPGTTGTTYNTINSASTQHEDGIGGEWFFDGWMGTWTIALTTASWKSTLSTNTWSADLFAISSFPHNELGKDFRFNLRILHAEKDAATGGTAHESYYWYHVNEITIEFPHAVSYALHNDYKRGLAGIGSAANNVNVDYQMMNVANAEERVNIIPPLDLGTWDDINFFRTDDWVRTTDASIRDGAKINRIMGWLDSGASTKASWCTGTDAADENFCATKFKISGLMNTYDEHFAAQMGNIQEIWIQLSYAMQDVTNGVTHSTADEDYVVESPFPYLHFHATEIKTITATCSTTNVGNGNLCGAYNDNALHKGTGNNAGPFSG